jgi:hypothetical protein
MSDNDVLQSNETKLIDRLDAALTELEDANNVITLSQFRKYEPLFKRKTDISFDQIQELSKDLLGRFSLYSPIKITDHTGKLLFKVPRLFIPVNDINEEYKHLLTKFYNDSGSDIPKYASEATNSVLLAILKSQEDITDTSYQEYIKELRDEYDADIVEFQDLMDSGTAKDTKTTDDIKEVSVDINKLEGLSWT